MTISIVPDKFLDILCCLHCKKSDLSNNTDRLVCKNCGYEYPINNGIPDLTIGKPIRQPKIYNDADYQRLIDSYTEIQDFLYQKGRVVSYVQNAGHRIVEKLKKKKYRLTLDLGCGDGSHYPYLTAPDDCFGIDINQKSLEQSKAKFKEFFVIRAGAYDLPVQDASVDCITSIYNLEHLVYLDLALEEMYRILLPEGDIFISVPTEGSFFWSLGRKMSTSKKFTNSLLDWGRAIQIEHINCIWQIEKAIRRYFVIKKRICFPFCIPAFRCNLLITYHCGLRG